MVWRNPKFCRIETLSTRYLKKMLDAGCLFVFTSFLFIQIMGTWKIGISQSLMQGIGIALGDILAKLLCFKFRVRCLDSFHLCFFER